MIPLLALLIVYLIVFLTIVAVGGVISHRREIRRLDQATAAAQREVFEVVQQAHKQMVAILQAARRDR